MTLTVRKKEGQVYFMACGCGRCGLVKIGYAPDANAKLYSLQEASPHELRLLRVIPGTPELRRELVIRFSAYRVLGAKGWFRLDGLLKAFIAPDGDHLKYAGIVKVGAFIFPAKD